VHCMSLLSVFFLRSCIGSFALRALPLIDGGAPLKLRMPQMMLLKSQRVEL
jgi:hypothetical protein